MKCFELMICVRQGQAVPLFATMSMSALAFMQPAFTIDLHSLDLISLHSPTC